MSTIPTTPAASVALYPRHVYLDAIRQAREAGFHGFAGALQALCATDHPDRPDQEARRRAWYSRPRSMESRNPFQSESESESGPEVSR